ncbi:MAG: hypothetical protein HOM58_11545 [Rhodospirillaceae bacterium]|jgi:hypothetical protein|nr:hypothetical protein [Rhodospirillaceae bacterium]MBT5457110.1 hypothetical protein [Rhodospirillaceae bacterium]
MTDPREDSPDNLIQLDRSPFSPADLKKIEALGEKQKLLYRWFRSERITQPGLDLYKVYSGARGRTPYAAYRVERYSDGTYKLLRHRTDELLAEDRTLDAVLEKLPDDFFYSV